MFLVSNNSDDPLSVDPLFCATLDAQYPGTCATMPAAEDFSANVDPTTGEFTIQTRGMTFAPEPSAFRLRLVGGAGLALARRKRQPR